ncbi:MAG: hypothetical protein O2894_10440 [Planctomycetota bacterium]|nr:hypothetical protein [Planctomycetota bacterium]
MLDGFNPRHVRIVGSYWMRFSLRTGGGLVAVLLALVTGLTVAQVFITPVENVIAGAPELGHTEDEAIDEIGRIAQSEQIVNMVEWLTGQDQSEVEYLLGEQPALLSVIWLLLLVCFPFLTALSSFNQTAGDIGSRGLRYLLLRTERANIYVGRAIGSTLFSLGSLLLLIVMVALYVGLKLRLYSFGDVLGSSVTACLALVLLSLPYIALCGWVSAMFDSAFAALAMCLVAIGVPIVFIKIADGVSDMDLAWMERLTPWGWKYELLSGDIGIRLLACAVMLGFTALFGALGLMHFHRRDL